MKPIKIENVNEIFFQVMVLLITVFFILLVSNPLGSQLNVFYAKTADLFADFFNLQIYIYDNDVYHNMYKGLEQKNYFPLAYVVLALFSGFEDYSRMTLDEVYSSHPAMISCVLFTLFSVLLFYHSLNKIVKLDGKMIFIISFSSIFLFTIERANLIMLAAAAAFYFIAYKDSDNRMLRYFALLSLCFSVVLKGYPVVLGLYLLLDKRYKDILSCIVITILLAFIPFLFFKHGFNNIPQFISNVQMNNHAYDEGIYPRFGLVVINKLFFSALHSYDTIFASIGYYISKYLVALLSLLSILLFFKERNPWKKLMIISIIIAYLPSNNGFYCGIYFFPSLILFLKDNKNTRKDFIYMLLYCLLLNPVQIVVRGMAISWMMSNLAMLAMWLLLIIDSLKSWRESKNLIQLA